MTHEEMLRIACNSDTAMADAIVLACARDGMDVPEDRLEKARNRERRVTTPEDLAAFRSRRYA